MVKVSCILTSYNRPVYVQEAIRSVMAQTYPHWELFIVDDNSNEATQEVIARLAAEDFRIQVIQSSVSDEDRPKTTRYASCINLAIPHVTGDLVSYMTDDDLYFPICFEKMAALFEANPDIHVAYGMQRLTHLQNGVFEQFGIRYTQGIVKDPFGVLDHTSIMHRTSCYSRVPLWNDDPMYWAWADAVFFRAMAQHWEFHPLDEIIVEKRYHYNSVQAKAVRGDIMYSDITE